VFENHRPTCSSCGGATRRAFASSTSYVTCRRCGHVAINRPVDTTPRCVEHPSYAADYCPSCGTAATIGGTR
jgi:hypothetical protein